MFAGDDFKMSANASSPFRKPADLVRSDTALEQDTELISREMRFWAEIAKLAAIEMRRPEADRSSEAEDAEFFKMFPEATLNRVDFQPPMTRDVGRPQKRLAQNVANELADKYFIFTGKQPTFITATYEGKEKQGTVYGPYLDFTREIFALLNITADPLSYASIAAHKLRGCGRKK